MKKTTIPLPLLLAGCLALVAACGEVFDEPQGTRITDAQLCMFRIGMTTAEDVAQALGQPQISSNAGQTLILMYRFRAPAEGFDELLVFEFENFILQDVTATSSGTTAGRVIPACLAPSAAPATGEAE